MVGTRQNLPVEGEYDVDQMVAVCVSCKFH